MINIISAFLSLFNVNYFLGFIKNGVFPLKLEEDEENEYVKKLFIKEEHEHAREKLIVHNLRLVAHIANKYESKDENIEDLISIGTIGLIKAIDTFSPEKDVKIATYAAKCIENEILMVLRSNKKLAKNVPLLDSIGSDKDGSEITLLDVIPSSERGIEDEYE
ncbi:MAG: sigma-70 family RNA polymerase sigma factor, partial [Bacilli bacterium]